ISSRTRSFGLASSAIFSFSRFSSRALVSWPIRSGMVMKYTLAPLQNCFDTQCNRQMRLAHTRRPEQNQVLLLLDEAQAGQFADLLLINRGLETEVELVEPLQIREVRPLRLQLHVAVILRLALALQQLL